MFFQKRRRNISVDLKLYQTVKAVVEIVKENYLVSRLSESSCIIYDYLGNGCFHLILLILAFSIFSNSGFVCS